LHQVGLDQGETYGLDVCAGELGLDENTASDLRAVLSWVYDAHVGDFVPEIIANQMALPEDMYPVAVHVLKAGVDEIARLFEDKAAPRVQRWAGMV
jgi:hypothetical protein